MYSTNTKHPMFDVLQSIVRKHLGIEKIVHRIIDNIGIIDKIILLGDYSRGVDSGIIDVLIVIKNINSNYLDEFIQGLK